MAETTRCSRCPDPQTHLVRTVGGVHRTCATCAEDLVHALGSRVRAVTPLPSAVTAPTAKRRKAKPVWDEAAELLPDNPFAAAITGLLRDAKANA